MQVTQKAGLTGSGEAVTLRNIRVQCAPATAAWPCPGLHAPIGEVAERLNAPVLTKSPEAIWDSAERWPRRGEAQEVPNRTVAQLHK